MENSYGLVMDIAAIAVPIVAALITIWSNRAVNNASVNADCATAQAEIESMRNDTVDQVVALKDTHIQELEDRLETYKNENQELKKDLADVKQHLQDITQSVLLILTESAACSRALSCPLREVPQAGGKDV